MASPPLQWRGEDEFSIDGVDYACRPRFDTFPSTSRRFCIRKPREVIERYETLVRRLAPRNVVEVGVYECGSTAMIAQIARPERLVAIDIEEQPNRAIEEFAAEQGFGTAISAHWGIDQADVGRLGSIAEREFGSAPIDLVIDDASHLLEQSRRTFEALFPRLRPGGEYVLEDWSWAHALIEVWPNKQPLTVLVAEAAILCAHHPEVVASVEVDRPWAVIRRGDGEIDPAGFSIAPLLGERGQGLIAGMESGGLKPRSAGRKRRFGR